jgi:hypothetical protein
MKYYKCVRGAWFNYNNRRRSFAPNQVIKLDESSDARLKAILDSHPNFAVHEVTDDVTGMVPRIEQLLTVPQPSNMMSRDDVIREIATYGVRPDVYALDQTLEQQLSTLRVMTKKNFVTVVDNNGRPTYVQNLKEFMDSLKKGKKSDQNVKDLTYEQKKKDAEIKVVEEKNYEEAKKSEKGATTGAIEKDDFDKYDALPEFDKFVDEKIKSEVKELEKPALKVAVNSKSEVDAESVSEDMKFPSEKMTPEFFRYLVELDDKSVFGTTEYTEEDKQEMRTIDWRHIPQDTLLTMLISKGVNLREMRDNLSDQAGFRRHAIEKLKELIHEEIKVKGDLPIIEINAISKRNKDIDKEVPKKLTSGTVKTLKGRLSKLRKLGACNRDSNGKWDVRKLRNVINHTNQLLRHGLSVPETTEEMEDKLRSKGVSYK